jgi:hypothetical protein
MQSLTRFGKNLAGIACRLIPLARDLRLFRGRRREIIPEDPFMICHINLNFFCNIVCAFLLGISPCFTMGDFRA